VYSASAFASQELPGMDVALRGAVSIARRLQDPLAELVKIDPKSIGVGQYQHDVDQFKLARALDYFGLPETFFIDHEWRFVGTGQGGCPGTELRSHGGQSL
jgi:hypothetical protein